MVYDLNKLNINNPIQIDQDVDMSEYQNKEIIALKDLHLKGKIYYDDADDLIINLVLTGVMDLRDSVSLEVIHYPLNIKITEEDAFSSDFLEEYLKNTQNTLDIIPILWEIIVLEVPMRLTKTKDTVLSGDGWSYGENKKTKDNIDPRLAKLNELLDD